MVKIVELGANETFTIPADRDGHLSRSVLKEYFPEAVGLMYFGADGNEKILVS